MPLLDFFKKFRKRESFTALTAPTEPIEPVDSSELTEPTEAIEPIEPTALTESTAPKPNVYGDLLQSLSGEPRSLLEKLGKKIHEENLVWKELGDQVENNKKASDDDTIHVLFAERLNLLEELHESFKVFNVDEMDIKSTIRQHFFVLDKIKVLRETVTDIMKMMEGL